MQHLRFSRPLVGASAALALLLLLHAAGAQSLSPGTADPAAEQTSAASGTEAMPPLPPQDADAQPPVRLSDVEGAVRISDKNGKLFDQALQNMAVLPGMSLETGNDGRVELEFPDGSVARVTPNSALALSDAFHDRDGRVRFLLKPVKGLTYYELVPGGSSFAIQIGPLTARNLNRSEAALLRVNLDATPYQAAALEGSLHFEDASGNAAYNLEADQVARIDPAVAANYDIVMDLVPDSWDSWNADRRSARAEVAQATSPSGENTGPGWNDLNYYGSWYNVPGEGAAWAPDGVGEDFDPYGSGAWGYYTGAGYGWISSYPWGWLPYHCGLWNHYQGYGWMWRPANCGWGTGQPWYPYTVVQNPPYRYHLPSRPLPPRGVGRGPRFVPSLVAVRQAPAVRFRALGEPRPVSRSLIVSGVPVQPLPVEARPSYRSVLSSGGFRSAQGDLLGSNSLGQPARPGQAGYLTGARTVAPVPSYVPQTPRVFVGPPRITVSAPAPRVSAPPAAPAPAPPASGRVH